MKALFVTGGILLAILLLGEIRIGGMAEYREGGFILKAKITAFWFDIYPKTNKSPRGGKKKKTNEVQGKGGNLGLLLELVPVIAEAVGKLLRKIRIDMLVLHLTWAAEDPAAAAMGYGAANAAMGMIYQPMHKLFRIKREDVCIDVDFEQKEPLIYGKAMLTITIGQVVILCLRYGVRALKVWDRRRKNEQDNKNMKEAKPHE